MMINALRFPLNYMSKHYIEAAISSFGHLVVWEQEEHFLARIILKVRVVDLELDPHFILFIEGKSFQSQSQTVQCEIIEQQLLGALPPNEDPIPELNVVDGAYDFFGFGQVGPQQPLPAPQNGQGHNGNFDLNWDNQEEGNNENDMIQNDQHGGLIDLNILVE